MTLRYGAPPQHPRFVPLSGANSGSQFPDQGAEPRRLLFSFMWLVQFASIDTPFVLPSPPGRNARPPTSGPYHNRSDAGPAVKAKCEDVCAHSLVLVQRPTDGYGRVRSGDHAYRAGLRFLRHLRQRSGGPSDGPFPQRRNRLVPESSTMTESGDKRSGNPARGRSSCAPLTKVRISAAFQAAKGAPGMRLSRCRHEGPRGCRRWRRARALCAGGASSSCPRSDRRGF